MSKKKSYLNIQIGSSGGVYTKIDQVMDILEQQGATHFIRVGDYRYCPFN